jgi:hypothetical protein
VSEENQKIEQTGASAHGYDEQCGASPSVVAEGGSPGSSAPQIAPRSIAPLSRRDAIQWVLAAVAASYAPEHLFAQATQPQDMRQHEANQQPDPTGKGYGGDPELLKIYKPGVAWKLTMTADQKKTATALADVILPKDQYGPAASEVGVVAMIDEWVSAPYPQQQGDKPVIVEGLAWIDGEAKQRFGKPFSDLNAGQHHEICDDICYVRAAKQQFKKPAAFFARFRSLAASAYYATPPGWEAIGYVGNVALPKFDGPPPEVLAKLGLEQTVQ